MLIMYDEILNVELYRVEMKFHFSFFMSYFHLSSIINVLLQTFLLYLDGGSTIG